MKKVHLDDPDVGPSDWDSVCPSWAIIPGYTLKNPANAQLTAALSLHLRVDALTRRRLVPDRAGQHQQGDRAQPGAWRGNREGSRGGTLRQAWRPSPRGRCRCGRTISLTGRFEIRIAVDCEQAHRLSAPRPFAPHSEGMEAVLAHVA